MGILPMHCTAIPVRGPEGLAVLPSAERKPEVSKHRGCNASRVHLDNGLPSA